MNFYLRNILFLLSFVSSLGFSLKGANPELANPTQTIFTHSFYLQHANYNPAKAAKTIYGKKGKEAEDLAIKLKLYMDAKLLVIDTALYPSDPRYKDSTTGRHVFFPFPAEKDIYLQRVGSNWYFSSYTVSQILSLYENAIPFGSDLLISLFGSWGQKEWMGYWVWQWIGLGVFISLFLLVYRMQWWIIDRILIGIIFRKITLSEKSIEIIHSFAKYGSMYLQLHYARLFFPSLQFSVGVNIFVLKGLEIASVVFLVLVFQSAINLIMVRYEKIIEDNDNTMALQFRPVLKRLLQATAIIVGSVIILNKLGANIGALLAGVSIVGLALALAAQDTVKHFFGSVMIFLDQPFKIGDRIVVEGVDGIVELVSIRATRIRTLDNSLVYIPNGKLADAVINNFGLRIYRRYLTNLSLTYDTPPVLIDGFVKGVKEIIALHPSTRKEQYMVYLNSFGESSLNVLMSLFFEVNDWESELQARHEIIISIVELAAKLGVSFAFPTSTLHIQNLPGKESLDPKYNTDLTHVDATIVKHIEQYKTKIQSK